jgi:tricorn protease
MWIGDTIFFNSDRDGHFNLYAYSVSSGRTSQVTANKEWDVRWPSLTMRVRSFTSWTANSRSWTRAAKRVHRSRITVPMKVLLDVPSRIPVGNMIESRGLSPRRARGAFQRVETSSLFRLKGTTRNLTQSLSAHDKWPSWSPDGSQIAYISDKTAKKSSTWKRRMVRNLPNRSLPAERQCVTT